MKHVILSLSLVLVSSLASADIYVVVSKDSQISQATKTQIKNVFLGKSSSINGIELTAFDSQDTRSSNIFSKKILGRSKSGLNSYWSRQIFAGKSLPPEKISLQDLSRSNPEYISYIRAEDMSDSFQVILKLESLK